MRLLTLGFVGLFALPLNAGTRYAIAIETTGDPLQPRHRLATVLAEGASRRVDVEQASAPFTYDVLLSSDGGATFIALNTALKTWFQPKAVALVRHPRIAAAMPGGDESVGDVSVTVSEEPSLTIDGFATREHVIRASFTTHEQYGGTRIDARHGETILVWTTDAIDPSLAVRAINLTTGHPAVDAQLAPALAKITGFPLKTVVAATRAFTGGRPQTITVAATVSDIRTADAPPHAFERPPNYVNQEPFIGAPSR